MQLSRYSLHCGCGCCCSVGGGVTMMTIGDHWWRMVHDSNSRVATTINSIHPRHLPYSESWRRWRWCHSDGDDRWMVHFHVVVVHERMSRRSHQSSSYCDYDSNHHFLSDVRDDSFLERLRLMVP